MTNPEEIAKTLAEKECLHCRQVKPLSEFWKSRLGKMGTKSYCKNCGSEKYYERRKNDIAARAKAHYIANVQEMRAKGRGRKKDKSKEYQKSRAWAKKNPQKRRAHEKVKIAKRDGKLVPLPCEICGSTNVQAHHEDYSKPLEVRWLCRLHHESVHHPDIPQSAYALVSGKE